MRSLTVVLSLIAFVGGGLVGLGLLFARVGRLKGAELLVGGYVQLFQGTPLLMQLFLAYFGIGLLGIDVSPWRMLFNGLPRPVVPSPLQGIW